MNNQKPREGDGNSHFLMAVSRHDQGGLLDMLDEQISHVLQAIVVNGGKGSVTLNLEFKPNKNVGIVMSPKVLSKLPAAQSGDAMFFVGDNHQLVRTAPAMHQLRMNVVDEIKPKLNYDDDGVVIEEEGK